MALAALIISIVAGLAALAAVAVSWWQLGESKVANQLPAVIDLFGEYRSPGLSTARRLVFQRIGPEEQRLPLSQLPDDVRPAALQVCHYFDNLGVLVAEELVEPEIVARFLGTGAIAIWKHLLPCIELERERRQDDYQRYFESLASQMQDIDPAKALRHLARWPGSNDAG